MKLNHDCLRDVLLAVESCEMDETMVFDVLCERLSSYSENDIRYSCIKLHEAGFIEMNAADSLGSYFSEVIDIWDITYQGHVFLETVRPDSVWKKVRSAVSKVGGTSIPIVLEIAKTVAASLITAQLQSPP